MFYPVKKLVLTHFDSKVSRLQYVGYIGDWFLVSFEILSVTFMKRLRAVLLINTPRGITLI